MSEWRSMDFNQHTELRLLEALEQEPETTQADLAAQVGVAVGTVNWYIKRWSSKGLVIVKRMDRWRWRYLITPKGMAEKSLLAKRYVEASMRIYRNARADARAALSLVQAAGYKSVAIDGEGDVADICQLTCLELGIKTLPAATDHLPVIKVEGMNMTVIWPGQEKDSNKLKKRRPKDPSESSKSSGDSS